jgi:alpha-galactosidase
MSTKISIALFTLLLCTHLAGKAQNTVSKKKDFKQWAKTPPMGWNSYNCYGAAVMESEVIANADYMAEKLKHLGWEYIVVDYCWSYPHPPNSIQNNPPQFRLAKDNAPVPWLAMDKWGRLLPDPCKFPSSEGNGGFKELANYIHGLGLKFGIHVMRGIPRQAVWAKAPVKGTNGITADMIADTTSICPWLNQMYGVDISKPGAQEYYNSLIELYAEWGVDYIKMDDLEDFDDNYHQEESQAMHKAIMKHGREIVLSLSPRIGFKNMEHVKSVANLFRISHDFWDDWEKLEKQFELIHSWEAAREPGTWPDADMLQLGWISRRGPEGPERESRFTKDEQITHMTLWCICKSSLMMGGDMPDNSPFVENLLTAEEVLEANQNSCNARQFFRQDGQVVWISDIPDSEDIYLAMFNLNESGEEIQVDLGSLGFTGKCKVRDLWREKDLGIFKYSFQHQVNSHGAQIFRLESQNDYKKND